MVGYSLCMISFGEVYEDLCQAVNLESADVARTLGYKPLDNLDDFRLPKEGETYLTPDGKIATKEKGDKGPYGPRLIVVEDLTESERIYGKGIKTGADALAKVLRVSGAANDCADGTDINQETFSTEGWEVVELRKLQEGERTTYIEPNPFRDGFEIWLCSGSLCLQEPVYIVRKKQPRKKRVLVFDYDEVAGLSVRVSLPDLSLGLLVKCLRGGGSVVIWGTIEEREE